MLNKTSNGEKSLIKFRIDVDYPYSSRIKSFLHIATNLKTSKEYLKNSKILAKMFNDSSEEIKIFWFFTIKTLPDKELLSLINNSKHEIALHMIKSPHYEFEIISKITKQKIRYYTIHGTSNFLTRLLWRRWKARFPEIPKNFPLKSFHQFPTLPFDALCYRESNSIAVKIAQKNIAKNRVLEIHPQWLFQKGKMNRRGAYNKTLKKLLKIDDKLQYVEKRKKMSVTIGRDYREYQKDIFPNESYIKKLRDLNIDVFTFIERAWSKPILSPNKKWIRTTDNVAILNLTTYDSWWKKIGKKTRNMVRKSQKSGIITKISSPNLALAKGICKIYNETPIRQNRIFPHYGTGLKKVERNLLSSNDHVFIGSYYENELVGFVDLIIGENITIISQILSLKKYWNKAINNSLIAKTVEVCLNHNRNWLMYGRMGNHPSLDRFKSNIGFERLNLNRYYIILTLKGKLAVRVGLHRNLKDVIPQRVISFLLPVYNWFSTMKIKKN